MSPQDQVKAFVEKEKKTWLDKAIWKANARRQDIELEERLVRAVQLGLELARGAVEKKVDERQLDNGLPDSFRGWNNARTKSITAIDDLIQGLRG